MVKMGIFSFLFGRRRSEERLRDSIGRVATLYKEILSSEHRVVYDLHKEYHLIQRERNLRSNLSSLERLKDSKRIGEEAKRILDEERRIVKDMEYYVNKALRRIKLQRGKIRAIRRYL